MQKLVGMQRYIYLYMINFHTEIDYYLFILFSLLDMLK